MTTNNIKLAEYIFARLKQLGIETVHGVPGYGQEMRKLKAVADRVSQRLQLGIAGLCGTLRSTLDRKL